MCVSLGAIRKCSHTVGIELFYKGLLKSFYLPSALSFSPDIDTICHSRLEIDSTSSCWKKKLIWIQLNQIKPLGFDTRSNNSSWRLFFKWSVSYPCFWPQNSFSTCQQVSCSLRIFKTLHLLCILRSSIPLQWCNTLRIRVSSVRSPDHRQSYVNHLIPKNQKHSSGWLSPTQQWNVCCKMQILRQSSKTLQSLGLSLPRSHW